MDRNMFKSVLVVIGAVILLFAIFMVRSGFSRSDEAELLDYSVSEDGSQLTLVLGLDGDTCRLRMIEERGREDGILYLDPYGAFGGSSGKLGGKESFTVSIDDSIDTVALYRGSGNYDPVLVRSGDTWQRFETEEEESGETAD